MINTPSWPDFNAIPVHEYPDRRATLLDAYSAVRSHSRELTSRFSEAEQQIQSMPDASPTKWHLAHTTWFFETFLLEPFKPEFEWFDEHFCYLFNSYYNAVGSQYPRPRRGLIGKPGLDGVWAYRRRIDEDMLRLIERCDDGVFAELAPTLVLGLNHEQQHQELIRTDIKHGLFQSEKWDQVQFSAEIEPDPITRAGAEWLEFPGGAAEIGYSGDGFCFDNELALHEELLPPFKISNRLVTAAEWLEFMEDGGYEQPLLWLSDGWQWKRENDVEAPLYWRKLNGHWHRFDVRCRSGLVAANPAATTDVNASQRTCRSGLVAANPAATTDVKASQRTCRSGALAATNIGWTPVDPNEPIRHISYYEADAFAEWCGSRLPREAEREAVSRTNGDALEHAGECWEWTQSAYSAYPGFKPTPGMAGEYNGKFMVNQMVLRGSSPATPAHHSRPSYRNFFYPDARWQYSGLRLAKDLREARLPRTH